MKALFFILGLIMVQTASADVVRCVGPAGMGVVQVQFNHADLAKNSLGDVSTMKAAGEVISDASAKIDGKITLISTQALEVAVKDTFVLPLRFDVKDASSDWLSDVNGTPYLCNRYTQSSK